MAPTSHDLINLLIAQSGDRYVFGAEANPNDLDPDVWDCAELIEWGCARLFLSPRMPDGSWIQWRHCRDHGTLTSIKDAIQTPGALLFAFGSSPSVGGRPSSAHVALSLGNGLTIEARGRAWGVGSWTAEQQQRRWTHAARIPGLHYTIIPPPPPPAQSTLPPPIPQEEEDEDMFFVIYENMVYRVVGNTVTQLGTDQWALDNALREYANPKPPIISDPIHARLLLEGRLNTRTGLPMISGSPTLR